MKVGKNNARKSGGDLPNISENDWYVLALTSAILTAVAICAAFVWIFGDGFSGDNDLKKSQALAPFGVALFAVVTFCTASWRGAINTRQANQAERESRAKLLQEGAKLLGEKDNAAHVSAGVATLEIVATGEDEKLAIQAMNLIADFIQSEMEKSHNNQFREEAFSAMRNGFLLGRVASRSLRFHSDNTDVSWEPLYGTKEVYYIGGQVEGMWGGNFEDSKSFSYNGVKFTFMDSIDIDHRFKDCSFYFCDIRRYNFKYGPVPRDNLKFKDCDFSGCEFSDGKVMPDFRDGDNFIRASNPPTIASPSDTVDWRLHFQVRDPRPQGS